MEKGHRQGILEGLQGREKKDLRRTREWMSMSVWGQNEAKCPCECKMYYYYYYFIMKCKKYVFAFGKYRDQSQLLIVMNAEEQH